MLDKNFLNKFPFAYNYFSNLLELVFENKRKFPQSIIFEGADTKTQYLFALELARLLNCQKDRNPDCNCINCRWIKTYSHPAVNNVSQIHFKDENDETKTVISVKQARAIEKNLSFSSDYHRFFIFFSSSPKEYKENELQAFEVLGYKADIDFSIEPLTYKTFNPATPNALLKSIEEPPERTTFIFLVKSREEILPTIVSRCLVFKLNGEKEKSDYNDILNLITDYPKIDYKSVFEISLNIQNYMKENYITLENFLNKMLEYLKDLLMNNMQNAQLISKINNDIKIINYAIKQTRANMNDKSILETMFLRITRGY